MLAGKTAIKSKIMHQLAIFRVFSNSNKIPKRISKNPLIKTASYFHLIYGGTITIKKSGFVKCLIPTIMYSRPII